MVSENDTSHNTAYKRHTRSQAADAYMPPINVADTMLHNVRSI
jgi:hypothetical protein